MLRGTIREYETGKRRAFLRFFACEEDMSHERMDVALPEAVVKGREPLLIIGAIAGG
jgi:molybdopterin synthase sulfur carrier subunit